MQSSTFLTRAEVADLTGYQQRRKQADWLRREGWPFAVGGDSSHPPRCRPHSCWGGGGSFRRYSSRSARVNFIQTRVGENAVPAVDANPSAR